MDNSSAIVLLSSNTIYVLGTCALVGLVVFITEMRSRKATQLKQTNAAPGPRPLPIVGNLAALDGYEIPYQAFGELAKKYGQIISLQLGSVPALVVNGIDNIKEVLITKTTHFDSRPNFRRYHQLFSGNKENSLAFCDWSETQKLRREMLVAHTFPRNFSSRFNDLNDIIIAQMDEMIGDLSMRPDDKQSVDIKPILLHTCANIFTRYFCSRTFGTDDRAFNKMITNFDKIFYEVNQGYAADFLPFLLPFHTKNLRRMEQWSHEIRDYILANIIEDRLQSWNNGSTEIDYVDCLVENVKTSGDGALDWNTALFALEDIIGGHSAIGNFLVKVFGYVAQRRDVQEKMYAEIVTTLNRTGETFVQLSDRNQLPYVEAVIMESLRLIASPIVPHVANQDSTVAGFTVSKGTLIFLNNYDLNLSEDLWSEPESFTPERFLKTGRLIKPDHFLPFGAGRRSCMGYKMVQLLSFSILATTVQHYTLAPAHNATIKVPAGSLAIQDNAFDLVFQRRC